MMKFPILAMLSSLFLSAGAVEWKNLDADHYLGGRKASEGYLQGKIVMVVRWDASNRVDQASSGMLERMEDIWESFKTKRFVLLGSPFCDLSAADAAKASVAAAKLTFPVYAGAGKAEHEPRFRGLPTIYVIDETGLCIYVGKDDRLATTAIVQSLTDMESPKNEKQWRRFLDSEFKNLPAHAYLRLKAFNRKFPMEANDYLPQAKELVKIDGLKKVADLVEFARRAKDAPKFGPNEKAKRQKYEALVRSTIESCEPLKNVEDQRLAQEAKNAIADLKWTAAGF